MSDMSNQRLSSIGGEFTDADREAAFQSERMSETLRHLRLLFIVSAILNTLFLVSGWRFYGQPHFYAAIPARFAVILVSLACFLISRRVTAFRQAEVVLLI